MYAAKVTCMHHVCYTLHFCIMTAHDITKLETMSRALPLTTFRAYKISQAISLLQITV